jgi:cytochrome c-type biogenesis protein CcsB
MMYESLLIWGTIYLYALASFMLLTGFVFNKPRLLRISEYLVFPAFVSQTIVFVGRWARTGYFPANGDLENALTGSWCVIAFTVYLFLKSRRQTGVALFTVPTALLLLGFGVMSEPDPLPLSASFKSSWLVVHVFFAQLAFGAYAIASGYGLVYLLKDRNERRGQEDGAALQRLPRLEVMEESMFRFVLYGFIADAIMIVAGAIWAKNLWGSYWAWDPVEVWSLISWLLYGLAIHLRVTLGWRGRRQAWLVLVLLSTVIITYWGIDAVVESTRHIFGVEAGGGG